VTREEPIATRRRTHTHRNQRTGEARDARQGGAAPARGSIAAEAAVADHGLGRDSTNGRESNMTKAIAAAAAFALLLANPIAAQKPFSDGQVCQAAIATLNGHEADIIDVVAVQDVVVEVFYARPSDGKPFTYWCKFEPGGEIRWRDEYIGRWAENVRLYYGLRGDQLEIRLVDVGYEDIQTFTHADFE
jgi:hypothetical protein